MNEERTDWMRGHLGTCSRCNVYKIVVNTYDPFNPWLSTGHEKQTKWCFNCYQAREKEIEGED